MQVDALDLTVMTGHSPYQSLFCLVPGRRDRTPPFETEVMIFQFRDKHLNFFVDSSVPMATKRSFHATDELTDNLAWIFRNSCAR